MANDVLAHPSPVGIREDRFSVVMHQLGALIDAQTTNMVATSWCLPADIYTDPVRWNAEKQGIFRRLPLVAALSVELPNPGDMKVFDAAGPSILLTRDKAGKAHGFLNMCTHRGAKLVQDCAHASRIVCPYHAWSFQLDGSLAGVPRREAFDAVELEKRDLVKVPIGEWGGLIFVKAHAGDEEIDVQAWLGRASESIEMLRLDEVATIGAESIDIPSNWKAIMDTYCEGYHLAALHKDTIGKMFVNDVNVHNVYGDHRDFCYALQQTQPDAGQPDSYQVNNYVNITYIFPNTIIADYPLDPSRPEKRMYTFQRTFPGKGVFDTVIHASSFDPGGATSAEEKQILANLHRFTCDVVNTEDFPTAAGATENMKFAPPGFSVILGRNEQAVQGMHAALAEAAGMRLQRH